MASSETPAVIISEILTIISFSMPTTLIAEVLARIIFRHDRNASNYNLKKCQQLDVSDMLLLKKFPNASSYIFEMVAILVSEILATIFWNARKHNLPKC